MSHKKHAQKTAQKAAPADSGSADPEQVTEQETREEQAASEPETSEVQAADVDGTEETEATDLTQNGEVNATETPAVINTVAEAAASEPPAATETTSPADEVRLDSPVGPPATDLANRLTKAVNALLTTGQPEVVQALHKVELIVGDLKHALPQAIEASDDDQLKADLKTLLAVV